MKSIPQNKATKSGYKVRLQSQATKSGYKGRLQRKATKQGYDLRPYTNHMMRPQGK